MKVLQCSHSFYLAKQEMQMASNSNKQTSIKHVMRERERGPKFQLKYDEMACSCVSFYLVLNDFIIYKACKVTHTHYIYKLNPLKTMIL